MAKVLSLTLAAEQQLSFRHCGPAAIRMILSNVGAIASQADLWTAVTLNSAGGTVKPTNGSLVLLFEKQVCHQCTAWYCWYTTPEAMAATITQRSSFGKRAVAWYPNTGDKAVTDLIASLERAAPFPPAATVYGSNHWVVVNGYHLEDPSLPGAPPIVIGNRKVNGLYVMDPFEGPTPVVTFYKATVFRSMLKSIDCGPRLDRYPIVVGRDSLMVVKLWLYLWRWARPGPAPWPPPWPWRRNSSPIGRA